jgi:hypothetical protein
MFLMAEKKARTPKQNCSEVKRLVNLFNREKRTVTIGSKVEESVRKAIRHVLKPGQTPSEWIRETIIKRLREEAE